METLFFNTKVVHAKRVFCLDESQKKIINNNYIKNALDIFLKNKKTNKEDDNWKNLYI